MTDDCGRCEFYKNQMKTYGEWAKATDDEQFRMFIQTRDMRQFLNGFTEAVNEIHERLGQIEESLSLNSRRQRNNSYTPEYYGRSRDVNRRKDQ